MTLLRSLVLVVLTAAAAACSSGPSLPETDASIDGTLTEILDFRMSPTAAASVMVTEELPEPQDRTIVHVQSRTRVYVVDRGGQLRPADTDDLAVGDRVQVWTTGVELRSYPGQVFATRIHIVRQEVPGFD